MRQACTLTFVRGVLGEKEPGFSIRHFPRAASTIFAVAEQLFHLFLDGIFPQLPLADVGVAGVSPLEAPGCIVARFRKPVRFSVAGFADFASSVALPGSFRY